MLLQTAPQQVPAALDGTFPVEAVEAAVAMMIAMQDDLMIALAAAVAIVSLLVSEVATAIETGKVGMDETMATANEDTKATSTTTGANEGIETCNIPWRQTLPPRFHKLEG